VKRRISWIGTLLGALLAAALAYGATACLFSGFELEITATSRLIGIAALAAVIGAVLARFRYTWIVLAAGSVGGTVCLWLFTSLVNEWTAVLDRVTRIYEEAYGWPATSFYADPFFVKSFHVSFGWLAALLALWFGYAAVKRVNPLIVIGVSALPVVPCLVATDTAPAGGCAFLWLCAALTWILAVSGHRVRPVPSFRRTAVSAVAVVAAMALLFTMLPPDGVYDLRYEWRDRILHRMGYHSGSEGNDHTTLTRAPVEELEEASYPRGTQMVMKILASKETTVYLREQDFSEYDGRRWISDPNRQDSPRMGREADWYLSVKTPVSYARLFVPYYPASRVMFQDGHVRNNLREDEYIWKVADLPEDWKQQVEEEADAAMNPPESFHDDDFAQLPPSLYYHVDPDILSSDSGPLIYGQRYDPFGDLQGSQYDAYLQLPSSLETWAKQKVAPLYDESMTCTARADAIAAYVKGQAEYVDFLYDAPEEEEEYVRWFLEEKKEGCCVQFATATAMLLRAAGVPTRYVTGYARPVKRTNWTAILETDAHAWVEYYEPMLSRWICLETTPPSEENTVVTTTTAELSTVTTVVDDDEETTPTTTAVNQEPDEGSWDGRYAWILQTAIAVVAVVGGLFAQRAIRRSWRRRRRGRMPANDYARRRYAQACRLSKMAKDETPEELVMLAEKAAFSQHTLSDEEIAVLDGYCKDTAARIRSRSVFKRIWLYFVFITE